MSIDPECWAVIGHYDSVGREIYEGYILVLAETHILIDTVSAVLGRKPIYRLVELRNVLNKFSRELLKVNLAHFISRLMLKEPGSLVVF